MDSSNPGIAGDISWSSIPTDLLLAELAKRDADTKPQCGGPKKGAYDTALHVGALILILALSTLSCGFPLISRRFSKGTRQGRVLFLCQHFGTGVLMATAFVHLLPTAFNSLTNPCLPYAFSKGYRPMAGLIAMVSAFVVVAVESYLSTRGASHSHSHCHDLWDDTDDESSPVHEKFETGAGLAARRHGEHRPAHISLADVEASEGLVAGASPLPEATPTLQMNGQPLPKEIQDEFDQDSDMEVDLDELDPIPVHESQERPLNGGPVIKRGSAAPVIPPPPNSEEQQRLFVQCLLLEAGILFHSIFIGMALSVATGPTAVVFLIAISFHQSFEGLALGGRIAAIQFPKASLRPWLMVLAFGATTPFGQAIGLIVHNLYDPRSQTGLLMVGFMNAISAGLLLFAGLVQLLAEDFLSEKSYKTLKGKRRIQAYLSVVGGAALMAGVGALA